MSKNAAQSELILTGLAVAPGLGVGPSFIRPRDQSAVPRYRLKKADIAREQERFRLAALKVQVSLMKLKKKTKNLPISAGEELNLILDAHMNMVGDSSLMRGTEARIASERINAEAALAAEVAAIELSFQAIADPYLAARAADVRDVYARLKAAFDEKRDRAQLALQAGSIVVAHELSPADTALMTQAQIMGFALETGGPESHTAIMARSLGLPAVVGVHGLLDHVRQDQKMVVDGDTGRVILNPSAATLADYEKRRRASKIYLTKLQALKDLPARTLDGKEIVLNANLEMARDIDAVLDAGAMGVGLLRTEFLYLHRELPPSEDEQFKTLASLVRKLKGKPLTVRTLDVGAEKNLPFISVPLRGQNPALALRSTRLLLRERHILESQLAACLRASAKGPLRILIPMVASVDEIREVRSMLEAVHWRLKRRGVKVPATLPPLGVMIEVPGAALAADSLASASDFFAIGTNDLTMYTLAIDRGDEQVAHLYNPLHPAVLRLIQFTVAAAARARIPVSVCGEMAGNPRYTQLLLGLGVDELSVSANSLLRIKERIRELNWLQAQSRAHTIMDQTETDKIIDLIDQH